MYILPSLAKIVGSDFVLVEFVIVAPRFVQVHLGIVLLPLLVRFQMFMLTNVNGFCLWSDLYFLINWLIEPPLKMSSQFESFRMFKLWSTPAVSLEYWAWRENWALLSSVQERMKLCWRTGVKTVYSSRWPIKSWKQWCHTFWVLKFCFQGTIWGEIACPTETVAMIFVFLCGWRLVPLVSLALEERRDNDICGLFHLWDLCFCLCLIFFLEWLLSTYNPEICHCYKLVSL